MSDGRKRARLRLWLRAERAMGLPAIPRQALPPAAQARASSPAASPVSPRPAPSVAAGRAAVVEAIKRQSTPPEAANPPEKAAAAAPGPQMALLADPNTPFTAPPLDPEQKRIALQQMDANEVKGCTR